MPVMLDSCRFSCNVCSAGARQNSIAPRQTRIKTTIRHLFAQTRPGAALTPIDQTFPGDLREHKGSHPSRTGTNPKAIAYCILFQTNRSGIARSLPSGLLRSSRNALHGGIAQLLSCYSLYPSLSKRLPVLSQSAPPCCCSLRPSRNALFTVSHGLLMRRSA